MTGPGQLFSISETDRMIEELRSTEIMIQCRVLSASGIIGVCHYVARERYDNSIQTPATSEGVAIEAG